MDGVGGWINKLIDSGIMTKEYIGHLGDIVDLNGIGDLSKEVGHESMSLSEIMDDAMKRQKAKGSTTIVMAHL